jgi:hypothetical protein
MPEALLDAEERRNGTLALALLSLFVGGLSGLVCATFRLLLQRADTLRGGLIALAHGEGSMGFLFVIAGDAGWGFHSQRARARVWHAKLDGACAQSAIC